MQYFTVIKENVLLLHLIYATYSVNDTLLWQDIYASYLLQQYQAYIYSTTIRVIVSPLIPHSQVWITFVCGQWRTHVRQSGQVDRRVQMSVYSYRHASSTCACAVQCMRFLAYFLRFRCLNTKYIVQYRRKKCVFVPSRLPAALLPFCVVVVDITLL